MKKRRDFIHVTKTEMINDLLNSTAFKIAKFISLGLLKYIALCYASTMICH